MLVLAALFLVVPIIELALIVAASQSFGFLNTLLVLLLMSLAGGWLVKREGVGVARRVQGQVERGQMPTRELVDGFLILLAGALLLTPGFFTDMFGIALLLPPVRAAIRPLMLRWLKGRVVTYRVGESRDVHDVASWEDPYRGHGPLGP